MILFGYEVFIIAYAYTNDLMLINQDFSSKFEHWKFIITDNWWCLTIDAQHKLANTVYSVLQEKPRQKCCKIYFVI